MSNIVGTKYTARELKQIDFYNKIKRLNKLNLSFKAIKDRNIEQLKKYQFIDSNYITELKAIDEYNFNSLVNEINFKIREQDKSLPKLETTTDTIHQLMTNPQFISINPKTWNEENQLFNELHNILRFYYSNKLGKRWYKKLDKIPKFFLFEENGKVRDVEEHTHYHLLIDVTDDEAKELKDFIFYNLLNLHKNHYDTIECNDLENVDGIIYCKNKGIDKEICKFPQHNLAKKKEHIDKKTGEIIFYSLTYLNPKYPKLDIELGKVKNDGIYSYSIKEDITDEKKQLLGMDFYNKISKIYNKQDVLFANSY
ncbi:MAG: hypothetical protein E7020_05200 [Alphaproteobacteria bacterium]|nr:hypothetical protein [Alphaproteobacteria bacterium]